MEAWSSGAETIYNNFQKGDHIFVEASAKNMFFDQDGSDKKLRQTKFRIDHFEPIVSVDYEDEIDDADFNDE